MNYALMGEIGGALRKEGVMSVIIVLLKRLDEELEAARARFHAEISTTCCGN